MRQLFPVPYKKQIFMFIVVKKFKWVRLDDLNINNSDTNLSESFCFQILLVAKLCNFR